MSSPLLWFGNAAKFLKSQLVIPGSTSGNLTLKPADVTTDYTLIMPGAQGGASTTLSNNGSGTLSWVSGLPAAGTDGQILKSMNSVLTNSSYFTPYINYVGNAFAEANTNGWATYADAASNIPVDGTGGTATGLTFSRTTSSPLRDTGTFSIVQTNSTSLQGKGVSYDFTINSADQAKAISIQFDYNASSTFIVSDGTTAPLNDGTTTTNAGNSDIEVFIYDVTNAVLVPVSPQVLTANGTNNFTFKGIFQTASNSTSYRLIFHCATTSANATGYTLKYTNVYVGPQYIVQGPPVTDWVSYTPTFTGFGTVSVQNFIWRRVGGNLEVLGSFTSGTSTAVEARVSFPNNLTSVSTLPTTYVAGITGYSVQLAGARYVLAKPSVSYFNFSVQAAANNSLGAVNGNAFAASGESFTMQASIPISGWSSTTLMSNDANVRVCAARYTLAAGSFTYTANQPIDYNVKTYDTHGAVTTGASWKFTAPVSGYYRATFMGNNGTSNYAVYLYKNGAQYSQIGANSSSLNYPCIDTISLKAGDYIDIRQSTTVGITASVNTTYYIDIEQIQGPSQITTSDTVAALYTVSGSVSLSTSTPWNATVKEIDTHSAVQVASSSPTGLWRFNAPISGTYEVCVNGISGGVTIMYIYKNGSLYGATASLNTAASGGSRLVKCVAGDYIDIRSPTGGAANTSDSNGTNYISIVRVGN